MWYNELVRLKGSRYFNDRSRRELRLNLENLLALDSFTGLYSRLSRIHSPDFFQVTELEGYITEVPDRENLVEYKPLDYFE